MATTSPDPRPRILAVSAGGPAGKVTSVRKRAARVVTAGKDGDVAAPSEPTAPKKTTTKTASTPSTSKKTTAKKTNARTTTAKTTAVATPTAQQPLDPKATSSTSNPEVNPPQKKAAVKRSTSQNTVADAAPKRTATAEPAHGSTAERLRVREDESPWTADELSGVKDELEVDVARLTKELTGIEHEIADLISDSGDGAGDDQADAGAKSFEREHEFSLADNSRQMLEQSEHALERIADGTYGICENCGTPIGKLRLQAFPRATLCLQCKQKQERR